MSIVGEGIDLIKISKEWKEEFEKKHNTDDYIFRITDLNNQLCEENCKLHEIIDNLDKNKLAIEDEHKEMLNYLYKNKIMNDTLLNNFIKKGIKYKYAWDELMYYEYISVFVNNTYDEISRAIDINALDDLDEVYKLNNSKIIEIIEILKHS